MARPWYVDEFADTPLSRMLARSHERVDKDALRTGGAALLRQLVRIGLREDSLRSAALLCAELDRPRDLDRLEQRPATVEDRQRIFGRV